MNDGHVPAGRGAASVRSPAGAARGGGGLELRGVVDEEQDDERGEARHQVANGGGGDGGIFDSLLNINWDSLCAYQTDKVVQIKDAKLGLLYWFVVTVVIMYITIVIFMIEGRQAKFAPGYGTAITRFKGKAFSNGKVYDEADLRFPAIEPTGAFVMTKRVVMREQKWDRCVDMDTPRPCPCKEGDRCVNGYCETAGWCPSLGDFNAATPPPGAVVESFEGLEHGVFQIVTSITFPGLGNEIFITGGSKGGTNKYNHITLGELVKKAYPKIKYEDVKEKGALIGVSVSWDCDVTSDCEPFVQIKALDGGAGFTQKRTFHQRKNGLETRDAIYMYGLRVLVDSKGVGRQTSLTLIVVQIGSGIALLRTASYVADFMMLKLYGAERRKAYYRCKIIETRDYSDLQDRLNLVQDHIQEKATLLGTPRDGHRDHRTGTAGAGAHVPLGLGPGARGGNGNVILRGRQS